MEENFNNEKAIQTIYSIFQMPDDEIYAPSFQDGETVIVIRWPYTNNYDFPILKVNNKHRESIAVLGQAKGVAGVSISTIMRLGADYGGDTAIIIPYRKTEGEPQPKEMPEQLISEVDMACGNVAFGHFRGAMAILNQLDEILKDCGVVRVDDLYDLVGLPAIEQGAMRGWTNLDDVKIISDDDELWFIKLPPVELLCEKASILQQSKKKQEVRSMDKVAMHKALCTELNDLYARKNADYGDSFHLSYMEEGMAMARIRLADKLNRFKALTKGNSQKVNDESIRDTLIDLANYALLTVLEMDLENTDPTSRLRRMIENKEHTLEVMKNGLEADDE